MNFQSTFGDSLLKKILDIVREFVHFQSTFGDSPRSKSIIGYDVRIIRYLSIHFW